MQQPLFSLETAAVPRERTIRTDDSVTRHDDADWVVTVRQADGSRGIVMTDAFCKCAIAHRCAKRNIDERTPYGFLERRPGRIELYIEVLQFTREISCELFAHAFEEGIV